MYYSYTLHIHEALSGSEIKSIPKNSPFFREYILIFHEVHLSSHVRNLLIELLQLPFRVKGEEPKWASVSFNNCYIAYGTLKNEESVSSNDIARLGTALASRVLSLTLSNSPTVLDCLLNTVPSFDGENLHIYSDAPRGISVTDSAKLGALITQSVTLKSIGLHYKSFESADLLVNSLADAIHLESLSFAERREYQLDSKPIKGLENILLVTTKLLTNPQSRLRSLQLSRLGLTDDHFLAITALLYHQQSSHTDQQEQPCCYGQSRLELLSVYDNELTARSILDFARRIPDMKFLRNIQLELNPWRKSDRADECWAALVLGVFQSYSIETLDSMDKRPPLELLYYHTMLNHAGRRIFTTSEPVPLGLWANILARAGTTAPVYSLRCKTFRDIQFRHMPADAIYFLLKDGPVKSLLLHHGQVTATL